MSEELGLTKLIDYLEDRIKFDGGIGVDKTYTSWVSQTGILLTENTVDEILEQLKRLNSDAFQETLEIQQSCFDIIKEYNKAKRGHPETDEFDINKMALVVNEEAGEVSKAVLQYQDEGGSKEEIKAELIQTAAMCLRMLLNLNKY
jgi:NTP pyrophosphatase (non-canonical NTP hydrolase)